jgi:GntR family transcriptional regulator / MocR family aminotransferase
MREPLALEPLFPDRSSGENLAVQLARRLREGIEGGTLRAGTRLLGSRQLAKRLSLGRNTVALAFEQLTAEGYLDARKGAGTFVAAIAVPRRPKQSGAERAQRAQPSRARRAAASRAYFAIATGSGPLRPGMPDLSRFPAAAWKRCARHALDVYDRDLGYAPASGVRALREAIATHVRQFRGVTALPEQVVIVEGAQAAIHLAATVLVSPGDDIVVEDPCYALARAAFEVQGLRLRAVPVDSQGIDSSRLPTAARLAFVTPTHQFPLGGALPIARRQELLAWAKRADAYIVEDDYDSEFTSKTRPLPALQSLDREERVLYVGSFSKTLAPSIRLGYLIVPAHLAAAFRAARASTSLGVSLHLQETAARFIEQGYFARHIRRMNGVYERRRAILVDTLHSYLRQPFSLGPTQTGLHVALIAAPDFNDGDYEAATNGDRLVPLSQLCVERRDCRGFVLGFANGSDRAIQRCARALAETMNRSNVRRT